MSPAVREMEEEQSWYDEHLQALHAEIEARALRARLAQIRELLKCAEGQEVQALRDLLASIGGGR